MSAAPTDPAHRPVTVHDTFVLVARDAVIEGPVLDLVDLSPSTIHVTWDQDRGVTHITTGQLLDVWAEGGTLDAPATFELMRVGLAAESPVRLRVREPRIVGSGLRWTVTLLDGWLPHQSGSCVLVVNPPEPTAG